MKGRKKVGRKKGATSISKSRIRALFGPGAATNAYFLFFIYFKK